MGVRNLDDPRDFRSAFEAQGNGGFRRKIVSPGFKTAEKKEGEIL